MVMELYIASWGELFPTEHLPPAYGPNSARKTNTPKMGLTWEKELKRYQKEDRDAATASKVLGQSSTEANSAASASDWPKQGSFTAGSNFMGDTTPVTRCIEVFETAYLWARDPAATDESLPEFQTSWDKMELDMKLSVESAAPDPDDSMVPPLPSQSTIHAVRSPCKET